MPNTYPSDETIKGILAQSSIVLDTRLLKKLGYDNTRDFFYALGNWGHNTDFNTIAQKCDTQPQSYLRAFVRSFLD